MAHRTVSDVLIERPLVRLTATISVGEAARLMRDNYVGAVLIMDGEETVGIFTERDIVDRVVAEGRDPDETKLGQVMTPNPVLVTTDMPITDAARTMRERHLRHLPVAKDGRVVGVVSVRDFLHDDIAQYLL